MREYAQGNFLHQMLQKVRARCVMSPDYLIMVLDHHTAKLLSVHQIEFFDLFKQNVYHLEDLNKQRKYYPASDVIYFVAPTEQAVRMICEDFPEQSEISFDHYGNVHLVFSSPCPQNLLELMVGLSPKLASRIATLFEANLDFNQFTDNVFLTPIEKPVSTHEYRSRNRQPLWDKAPDQDTIEIITDQLLCACATLSEKPHIQFQNTKLCEGLSKSLDKKLRTLYQYTDKEEDIEAKPLVGHNPKRALLLILDRTFDLATPLTHDQTYWSSVYELYEDPCQSFKDDNISMESCFNQKDMYWQRYKTLQVREAKQELETDIKNSEKDAQYMAELNKCKDGLTNKQMLQFMEKYPKIEQRQKQFLSHRRVLAQINQYQEANWLLEFMHIEQMIMSGIDAKTLEPLDERYVYKAFSKFFTERVSSSPEDAARVFSIFLSCYALPDKELQVMLNKFKKNDQILREAVKKIKSLKNTVVQGVRRIVDPISNSKDLMGDYRDRRGDSSVHYTPIVLPKIKQIAKKALRYALDEDTFKYVGQKPNLTQSANKRQKTQENVYALKQGAKEDSEYGKLIIFVAGGLTRQEIATVQQWEKDEGTAQILLGSTEVINGSDFLQKLHWEASQAKQKKSKQPQTQEQDVQSILAQHLEAPSLDEDNRS